MAEEALVEEEVVEETLPELTPEEQQYEDRGRRQGWRPKEQYSGDPSRWVDAKTFVLRGEAELPLIRERFRKMDEQFASTKTELNETKKKLNEASEVLVELRDMSRAAEDRSYRRAVSELQAKQREAVREANEQKYDEAQREMNAMAPPTPVVKRPDPVQTETPPPNTGVPNPVVTQWVQDNTWFNSDPLLHAYALAEESSIQREFPGWPVSDQLDEVKKRTMDRFPDKFGNQRRRTPAAVSTSAAPPAKPKGKTVKDLPADARAALVRFKKQIEGYKDQDYLDMYFGPEEAE